jgi:integrase
MSYWFDKSVNRWKIRIVRSPGGRRREIARTLPAGITRAQAEEEHQACLKLLYDTAHGKVIQDRPLSEAVIKYLDEEAPKLKSAKEIENHLKHLSPWIEGKGLSQIGEVAVDYAKAMTGTLAPATINQRLAWLRRIYNIARDEWKWTKESIKIKGLPVNNKRTVVMLREHLEEVMKHCHFQETADAMIVAMFTGMREGEVWKIGREYQILDDLIEIPVGAQKNNEPNYIPIFDEIREALSRFPLQIHPRTVLRDLQETGKALDHPHYIFHDIRRTTASAILEAGYSLEVVGQVLRHKSYQTTKGYAYLQTKTKKEAVARAFGVGKFAPKKKRSNAKSLNSGRASATRTRDQRIKSAKTGTDNS